MKQIPDDPIVSCIERTGYPPWYQNWHEVSDDPFYFSDVEDDEYEEDCDV